MKYNLDELEEKYIPSFSKQHIKELCKNNDCPECYNAILENMCPCSGYEGGICPFDCYPWIMNEPYNVYDNKEFIMIRPFGWEKDRKKYLIQLEKENKKEK